MTAPLPFPDSVEWRTETAPADYPAALAEMEARAAAIHAGEARERVWLLEHAPLYTAGTSADPAELIDPRFPVYDAGRGGRYTYHGPGQRIAISTSTWANAARMSAISCIISKAG